MTIVVYCLINTFDIQILSVHTHMHVSWLSLFGVLIFQNILVRERVRMREREREREGDRCRVSVEILVW